MIRGVCLGSLWVTLMCVEPQCDQTITEKQANLFKQVSFAIKIKATFFLPFICIRVLLCLKSTPLSGGGRSTGRSTDDFGPVDRVVDRAVDRGLNGQKNDRWPVDRAVDRKGISALSWLPTGRILRG